MNQDKTHNDISKKKCNFEDFKKVEKMRVRVLKKGIAVKQLP